MASSNVIKRDAFQVSERPCPSHALPQLPSALAFSAEVRPSPSTPASISQEELERIKEEARQEGLALGRSQGQKEVQEVAQEKLDALSNLLCEVALAWEDERKQMEASVADFAFVCVSRLIGDTLVQPGATQAMVRRTLSECGAWQHISIEVHPGDVELVRALVQREAVTALRVAHVYGSSEVEVGGCRIHSSEGSLDARLDAQLEILRDRLDVIRANRGATS